MQRTSYLPSTSELRITGRSSRSGPRSCSLLRVYSLFNFGGGKPKTEEGAPKPKPQAPTPPTNREPPFVLVKKISERVSQRKNTSAVAAAAAFDPTKMGAESLRILALPVPPIFDSPTRRPKFGSISRFQWSRRNTNREAMGLTVWGTI